MSSTNRHRDDKTPFGWPPLRDIPLPAEVPWDTHIHLLSGLSIARTCSACNTVGGGYPIRLLAAELGWFLTLREIVPRLKCKGCGRRLTRLELADGRSDGVPGSKRPSLDLLVVPPDPRE